MLGCCEVAQIGVASKGENRSMSDSTLASAPSHWLSKRSVGAISEAMKRSFASAMASDFVDGTSASQTSFVLALFQRRAYFELEAARYAGMAAAGATVVVGFPGEEPTVSYTHLT